MNKKGFTLIEIIICIGIISIIGTTTSIITIKLKNNKSLNDLTNNILKAAEVYANTEKDENGNNYINEIENGRGGIKIPLSLLVNKGYVKKEEADKIYKEYKDSKKISSNEDYYVLLADGSDNKEEYYCENNEYKLEASWKMNGEKTIYLCNKKIKQNIQQITNVNTLKSAFKNIDKTKWAVSKEYYDKLKNEGKDVTNLTYDENGLFIYYNETTKNIYTYYRGAVDENYLKLGTRNGKDLIWRIIWYRDNDKSMKIVLDDLIPLTYTMKDGSEIEVTDDNDELQKIVFGSNSYMLNDEVLIINDNTYKRELQQKSDNEYNDKRNYNIKEEYIVKNVYNSKLFNKGYSLSVQDNFFLRNLAKWYNSTDLKNYKFIKNNNNFCVNNSVETRYRSHSDGFANPFYNNNLSETFECNGSQNISSSYGFLTVGDLKMAGVGLSSIENEEKSGNYIIKSDETFVLDALSSYSDYQRVINYNNHNKIERTFSFTYKYYNHIIKSETFFEKKNANSTKYVIANPEGQFVYTDYCYSINQDNNKNCPDYNYEIYTFDIYPKNNKPVIMIDLSKCQLINDGTESNPFELKCD